jgi:demethylmenaquinone methyltransferase/2-methoxy-6-polyprenyl-1,4-benzoquinol methylase
MTNRFYSPDDQRADKVRGLFRVIARRYDRLNDLMSLGLHRRWKTRLVALAGNPRDVLDLCCGTGDIAQRFTGNVVGVDFTAEMLQVAQTRCSREPARGQNPPRAGSRLQFIQADALHLPFPDASFDVATVGYGLRNLAGLEAGLREIHRVLRPGGKLLSLDFGKPENPVWRVLYFAHLRFWLPLLGRVFAGNADAYRYILASLQAYPAQRGVKELMERGGFAECGFEEFCAGAMAINFGRRQ